MDNCETLSPSSAIPSLWRLVVKNVGPIVALNADVGGLPVYCVHSICGDVADVRNISGSLGPGQSFYGVQVPKEKMTAAFAGSIEAMAAFYVDALDAFQPHGPFALAGWSAGALIALEMAQQLRARGRDVPLLIAFDGAPCNSGAGLGRWRPLYLARLVANLPRWLRDDANQDWSVKGILHRIDSKLMARFRIGLPGVATTQTLDGDTVQDLLESKAWRPGQRDFIHAFYLALERYVPSPYAGAVLVYETRTQPLFHLRQIAAVWRKLAGDVEVVPLPGNHTGLFLSPARDIITTHLAARLAAMRGFG